MGRRQLKTVASYKHATASRRVRLSGIKPFWTAQPLSSATTRAKASAGSAAWLIGRPITK